MADAYNLFCRRHLKRMRSDDVGGVFGSGIGGLIDDVILIAGPNEIGTWRLLLSDPAVTTTLLLSRVHKLIFIYIAINETNFASFSSTLSITHSLTKYFIFHNNV